MDVTEKFFYVSDFKCLTSFLFCIYFKFFQIIFRILFQF